MIAGHGSRFPAISGTVNICGPIGAAAGNGHDFVLVFRHKGPKTYLVRIGHALFGQMNVYPVPVASRISSGLFKIVCHRGLKSMPRIKRSWMTDNFEAMFKAAVFLGIDIFFVFTGIQDSVALFKIVVSVFFVVMRQFQLNAHVQAGLAFFALLTMESRLRLVFVGTKIFRLIFFMAVWTQVFSRAFVILNHIYMKDFATFTASKIALIIATFADIFPVIPANTKMILFPFPANSTLCEQFIPAFFAVEIIFNFFNIVNVDKVSAVAALSEVLIKAVFTVESTVRCSMGFFPVYLFSALFAADALVFKAGKAPIAQTGNIS